MKTMTLRSLVLLSLLCPLVLQAAAPANDKFENATILVPAGPKLLNQNGSQGTADPLDPYIGGVKLTRTVWYRFDAKYSGLARLIIDDHTGVRAAVFALTDPNGNAGTLAFQTETNNTAGNDVDTLTFIAGAGFRYYICVEANGLFDLTVRNSLQFNDYFDDASPLSGNEGSIAGSNLGATDVDDIPTVVPDEIPKQGVWYNWTPTFTGAAVVDTNFSQQQPGTDFDTRLAIFTGTTLVNLVNVGSDNNSGYGSNSRVVFNAIAGTTYRIWVGGAQVGYTSDFVLSYYPATSPGVLEISALSLVGEDQGTALVRVRRWRAGDLAVAVNLKTVADTASAVTDFAAINATPSFVSGATGDDDAFERTQGLIIVGDGTPESSESFTLTLSAPTMGATVGNSSPFQVTILDKLFPTSAGFTTETLRVKESDGVIKIPLLRDTGAGVAHTHVGIDASSGTAALDMDYQSGAQNVFFQPSQTLRYYTLTLKDDGVYEGDEVIVLNAVSASDVGLSGFGTLHITIEDDDLPVPVPGRLSAILDQDGIGGSIDISISGAGAVTGKVIMNQGSLPFKGSLTNGRLAVRLGPVTGPIRFLTIQLVNPAARTYQVTLSDGELGSVAAATVATTRFSKLTPCPVAGYYTCADGGAGGIPQLMAASIKVDALGSATISGKIFDGTPLVASGAVTPDNVVWAGASLYKGKGRASIGAQLTTLPQTPNSAVFLLTRPGRANQSVELGSLDLSASGAACRYVPPAAGQRALLTWNPVGTANAELSGGGFGMAVVKAINVSTANKVTVTAPGADALKLTLTPATGFFSGTVLPTGATSPKPIYGVLLQAGPVNSACYGFFLNGIIPGRVRVL